VAGLHTGVGAAHWELAVQPLVMPQLCVVRLQTGVAPPQLLSLTQATQSLLATSQNLVAGGQFASDVQTTPLGLLHPTKSPTSIRDRM
jgi:predicted Zn-dependent protease